MNQSTTPASVLPTVASKLPTVAWEGRRRSPDLEDGFDWCVWYSIPVGDLPAWRKRVDRAPQNHELRELVMRTDAEAAITQARQDERERAFRAGWESAAALQYAGDGHDEIPPSKSVVAKMALDAFARGLTDGGNSK